MKVEFRKSFVEDLERTANKSLKRRIRQAIEQVEKAQALHEIRGLKKLRGGEGYY